MKWICTQNIKKYWTQTYLDKIYTSQKNATNPESEEEDTNVERQEDT
jgi:hypothetical protein